MLISGWIGVALSILIIAAVAAAILYAYHVRAGLPRVRGKIIAVERTGGPNLKLGFKWSDYSVTVRYRTLDGEEVDATTTKSTYGIPSAGDSITVLVDSKYGGIEPNPFPELWIVLAVVTAAFIWLARFFHRQMKEQLEFEIRHPSRRRR